MHEYMSVSLYFFLGARTERPKATAERGERSSFEFYKGASHSGLKSHAHACTDHKKRHELTITETFFPDDV